MFKKIKELITKVKNVFKKRKQAKELKKYFEVLSNGSAFLQYVLNDISRSKTSKMNRAKRRRFEREIIKNGTFSQEFVAHYASQIKTILAEINAKDKK